MSEGDRRVDGDARGGLEKEFVSFRAETAEIWGPLIIFYHLFLSVREKKRVLPLLVESFHCKMHLPRAASPSELRAAIVLQSAVRGSQARHRVRKLEVERFVHFESFVAVHSLVCFPFRSFCLA